MRTRTALAVIVASFCLIATASTPVYDQKFLLEYMQQTRADFEKSIQGLSEAQWNYKPAPDRWSVAEVSEHITKAEAMLGGMTANAVMEGKPATEEQKAKTKGMEEKILAAIPDRTNKAQAPDALKPNGKWKTQVELMQAFAEARANNEQFIKANYARLRDAVAPSPIGEMDAYQWMLFTAAHTKRHTAQILEVKADPGFPKK
jgi:hypothetical protein